MSNEPAWSHDYCIICGKQTGLDAGLYCSNACRLDDEDTTEPVQTQVETLKQRDPGSSSRNVSPFHLPPPVNFPPPRTTGVVSTSSRHNESSLQKLEPESSQPSERSSRSSMSLHSEVLHLEIPTRQDNTLNLPETYKQPSGAGGVSPKAKIELQRYEDCFKGTRRQSRHL